MHDRSRLGRLIHLVSVLFIAAGVYGCATAESTGPSVQPPAQAEKKAAPAQVRQPAVQNAFTVPYYPPPDRIDLCGEPAPLEHPDVMERFDREFTIVLYSHAQVYRLLKRKELYFPRLEETLRRLNLPEDLKYVAIAEIDSPPTALELRKAAGKRFDFEFSADSAFLYLGDLYRTYQSWTLAIAAYNCGERRIMEESRAQGVKDYYHMKLPPETERYIFRVLAIKAVLADPLHYGYELPKGAARR